MKKTIGFIILYLVVLWIAPLNSVYAEENHNADTTLYDALIIIREQCNIKLAFDTELAKSVKTGADLTYIDCNTILQQVLTGTPLWYITINDVIVIKPISEIPDKQKQETEPAINLRQIQTFQVSGLIRQKNTHESLPYSSILIEGRQSGTIANSDGYFTLITHSTDSLTLIISHIGFLTQKYKLHPPSVTNPVIIDLEPNSISIDAIEITAIGGSETIHSGKSQGHTTINVAGISGMTVLHPLDVILPLQLLPGIDGTTETSSGLRIRKSSPDKNLMLYDGYPLYSIDHFYGMLSAFNQKTIKDIQLYKGTSHAKYGGTAGGVIEITGKSGNKNNMNVDAGFDLLSANIMAEAPVGDNSSVILSFRRSYTDLMQSKFYKKQFKNIRYDIENTSHMYPSYIDADPEVPDLIFYDYTAKYTVKPSAKDVLSLSTYGGNDNVSYLSIQPGIEVSEESENSNSGISLRWARQWSPVYYSNILAGFSSHNSSFLHYDKYRYNRPLLTARSNVADLEQKQVNEISDHIIELNNSLHITRNYKFDFGVMANQISTRFSDIYNHSVGEKTLTDLTKDIHINGIITSIYIQNNLTFRRLKQFDAGLRSSYYNVTGQMFFEPRLSMNYEIIPNFSLKASFGTHTQFNNRIILIDQADYQYLWSLSDETRPVVKSNQLGAGFLIFPLPGFSIDIEFYQKQSFNLMAVQNILLRNSNIDARQVRKYFHYNNFTSGADLFLKKHFGSLQIWLAYTLSKSSDRSEQFDDNNSYPAIDDQLHELKLFGMYRHKGWCLSSSWIYGSGKRWDSPVAMAVSGNPYKKNSLLLPAYHRMDFSMEKKTIIRGIHLSSALKVFNLYNNSNVLNRQYFLNDTPLTDTADRYPVQINEVNGSGFMYNLVFNVRF